MIEILKFACQGFWYFVGTLMLTSLIGYYLVNGVILIWRRFMRMIMVTLRGWPPPHLDADGDPHFAETTRII